MKKTKQKPYSPTTALLHTSVQRVQHLSSSCSTQVSNPSNSSVSEVNSSMRLCKHCLRELPLTEFYYRHKQQCWDNLCKRCRCEDSRQRRKQISKAKQPYPVITEVKQRSVRMVLIMQALQCIRKRIEHKQEMRKREDSF